MRRVNCIAQLRSERVKLEADEVVVDSLSPTLKRIIIYWRTYCNLRDLLLHVRRILPSTQPTSRTRTLQGQGSYQVKSWYFPTVSEN